MKTLLMLVSGVGPRGGSRWIGLSDRGETLCVETRKAAGIAELVLAGASSVEVADGIHSPVDMAMIKTDRSRSNHPARGGE